MGAGRDRPPPAALVGVQLFSVIIAAVAAGAALVTVLYAHSTVAEARAARAEAERDRRRQRLEAIGAIIEDIYWQWTPPEYASIDPKWTETCNRLGRLLIGWEDKFPVTTSVTVATNPATARASLARNEIEGALEQMAEEDQARLKAPAWRRLWSAATSRSRAANVPSERGGSRTP